MSLLPNAPSESAKNQTGDFERFQDFARQVVSVPHAEIQARLEAERAEKRLKTASRASGAASKKS